MTLDEQIEYFGKIMTGFMPERVTRLERITRQVIRALPAFTNTGEPIPPKEYAAQVVNIAIEISELMIEHDKLFPERTTSKLS